MKRIRSLLILIGVGACLAGASSGAVAQKLVIHDPNVVVRQNIKGFHAISISNAIDLYLSQGGDEAVAVSATDEKWRDQIKTEVVNGVLRIFIDQRGWIWNGSDKRMKAYVSFNMLDSLVISGACDVFVDGKITGGNLDISLSGASDFKGAVQLNSLTVRQAGASDMHISGTVMGLTTIVLSGASDLKGYELSTEQCEAYASGASDVRITVNKELHAHASGSSDIYYKGEAVVHDQQTGKSGNVSKKG